MNELCPGCGQETLTLRNPVFDGFRKTGEVLVCASCGHTRDAPAALAPARAPAPAPRPSLFADTEIPVRPDLFSGEENGRLCRHCQNYVVNPFRQWCGWHRREVDAMDTCDRFEVRSEPS